MNRILPVAMLATALVSAQNSPMPGTPQTPTTAQDPREWLEEVTSERALTWVRERA